MENTTPEYIPPVPEKKPESRIDERLMHLKQYKGKSKDEMKKIAKSIVKKNKEISAQAKFTNRREKELARKLFDKYIKDYIIESVGELNTLSELVYLEVVQTMMQEKMMIMAESHKNKEISSDLLEMIHKNSLMIMKLKDTLGINKKKDEKTSFDALQNMMHRAKLWREQNQGSRSLMCPHCSKMILLKIRTDKYDASKHPFFKDKILYNQALIDLLVRGRLTRDECAAVLEVSPDYMDWLLEKHNKKNDFVGSGNGNPVAS